MGTVRRTMRPSQRRRSAIPPPTDSVSRWMADARPVRLTPGDAAMFDATMKLVLGWSVVSAFIVTTAFTLMSLVGWIRFANRKQQQGLYAALVLEVIVGSVAGLRSPTAVAEETKEAGKDEGVLVGRAEGIF